MKATFVKHLVSSETDTQMSLRRSRLLLHLRAVDNIFLSVFSVFSRHFERIVLSCECRVEMIAI